MKLIFSRYTISTLLTLLCLSSYAQKDNFAFTLKECVNYALEHQNSIKISKFDEYIAQKQVDNLLGAAYPQINGSVNFQGNIQLPQFILALPGMPPSKIKAGQGWQHTAGAQMSQLIFDGTFFLGLNASKEFVKLAEINTRRTQNDVMNQVATAYYNALTVSESGKLLDINLERVKNLYKDTDAMYKNGLVEKNDLDRIQLSINNLETEKIKFDRMKALTVELLKFQMGMPVESTLNLTEKLPEINPEKEEISLYEKADFSKRIEFTVLKQQELLENYNRRRYLVSYLPSVYGFAFYQYNMQSHKVITFDENATFSTSAAGLKINIPIFDGFRTNANVQQSKINLQKISVAKEMMERGMQMELANTLTNLQNSKDSYKSQKANVELAKRIYETSKLKYKEGVGSSLEVNNAETAFKEAEQNLLSAQLDYLNARLKIWQIKGELQEKLLN